MTQPQDATRNRAPVGPRAFDVIAFDLDGTLADTAVDIATAANEVLRGFDLPEVAVPEVRSRIGGGLEALVRGLFADHPKVPLDIAAARFREAYGRCFDQHTELYPGVAAVLEELAAMGIRMAVATNKAEALSRPLVEHLGIAGHFFMVVGPESIVHRKPDPEALTLILRTADASPSRALMVGDHPSDIQCGQAAGAQTCAATYGYAGDAELAGARPDFTIARFPDLLDHVITPDRERRRGR